MVLPGINLKLSPTEWHSIMKSIQTKVGSSLIEVNATFMLQSANYFEGVFGLDTGCSTFRSINPPPSPAFIYSYIIFTSTLHRNKPCFHMTEIELLLQHYRVTCDEIKYTA